MTVTQLRELLVATARAYMGANTYNGQKQEIIDIYNKNQPRPRGYKVQYTDAWCATFVSAMGYIAGFSRIVGSPPRVRGKDRRHREAIQWDGITPACAGKS